MNSWTEIRDIGKRAVHEGFHKYAKDITGNEQRNANGDFSAAANDQAERVEIASTTAPSAPATDAYEIPDT